MSDINDIVRKLIALATNNPNEQEARLAALKACTLIMENNVQIGQKEAERATRGYNPLSPEEEVEVADFFKQQQARATIDPDHKAINYRPPDPDFDDGFMKRRILEGWRKLREERVKFQQEVDQYERQTGRRYSYLWAHNSRQ